MRLLNKNEFLKYLNRDESCYATGRQWERLIPQHRINRGHGGTSRGKADNKLTAASNIIVFDSIQNGLIETDADMAQEARRNGWKLESWMEPTMVPCYHVRRGWLMLDNQFNAAPASDAIVQNWLHEVELLG